MLPFTVTVVIPFYIFRNKQSFVPDTILMKAAGIILMGLGLLLFAMTLRLFISAGKGTLAPWDPPRSAQAGGCEARAHPAPELMGRVTAS